MASGFGPGSISASRICAPGDYATAMSVSSPIPLFFNSGDFSDGLFDAFELLLFSFLLGDPTGGLVLLADPKKFVMVEF